MSNVSGVSFGSAAAEYQRGRPSYPSESVNWLLGEAETVADIGAGTGKLTQSLLGDNRRVIAVEPDERMLAALAESLPDVDPRLGSGEDLPLDDASVDLLTYGQAWHWVDVSAACAEALRVLAPGGRLGLIWNIRDESVDWVAELTDIITPSTAEMYVSRLLSSGAAGGAADRGDSASEPLLTSGFATPEHHRTEWVREIDLDQLVDMVSSRSYTIAAEPEVRESMLRQTRELGERVQGADGVIRLPYATHVFTAIAAD